MTSRAVVRARSIAYGFFYRLPSRWRRRLVRMGTAKFVVGAVVLVRTVAGDGRDRLVLLRQPPGRAWSLPAGLLKRGERAEAGAARELYEETGLRVLADELTVPQPSAIVHAHGRWIDVVFEARVPADTTLAVDGAEVLEAAWHPLADQVLAAVGDRAHLSVEPGPRPLGTAGGVGRLRDWIDGRGVLVTNGDAYLAGGGIGALLDGWDGRTTRLLGIPTEPDQWSWE